MRWIPRKGADLIHMHCVYCAWIYVNGSVGEVFHIFCKSQIYIYKKLRASEWLIKCKNQNWAASFIKCLQISAQNKSSRSQRDVIQYKERWRSFPWSGGRGDRVGMTQQLVSQGRPIPRQPARHHSVGLIHSDCDMLACLWGKTSTGGLSSSAHTLTPSPHNFPCFSHINIYSPPLLGQSL